MDDMRGRHNQRNFVRVGGESSDGEPYYVFDFLKCVELGLIPPDYSFTYRQQVSCLLAEKKHGKGIDLHPSASIYPNGTYHCFTCQANGRFDKKRLPVGIELQHMPKFRSDHLPTISDEKDEYIDWEYLPKLDEVLNFTQEVAQHLFWKSEAAKRYLISRGLVLDLAKEFEVGFSEDELWEEQLGQYSYDELVHAGVLHHSPTLTDKNKRVMKRLLQKGVKLEDMIIQRQFKKNEPAVDCYPYPILGSDARAGKGPGNRITFPLRLKIDGQWRTTSIYGRVARKVDKDDPYETKAHVKTVRQKHGIPQGGLGVEILDDPEVEWVWNLEAVLDNWSLRQWLGRKNIISIIGTGNTEIERQVAQAGKIVSEANDRDTGGRKATERSARVLRHFGLKQPIYDFTSATVNLNPFLNQGQYGKQKDWNDFWLLHRQGVEFILPQDLGIFIPEEEKEKKK